MSGASLRITTLRVMGFRNIASAAVEPGPHANVFVGDNGQGKTSLLEALDYVSTLRSFRGATRAQLVGHGQPRAEMFLRIEGSELPHEFRVSISRTEREFSLDGKRPDRAVHYYGNAACVVFHPQDLDLVRGAPEVRRRLLDRILVRVLDGYGEALRSYARALKSRNTLLRSPRPDPRAITAYDPGLARIGSAIVRARTQLAAELLPAAREAVQSVALEDEGVGVEYRTHAPDNAVAYQESLASVMERDLSRGATTIGPHTDDVRLLWRGRAARIEASQGQTRALALALRVAELRLITQRGGHVPWLLLDDVSSELDRVRTERLFALIAQLGAQVWITTTDPTIVQLVGDAAVFRVDNGRITRA